MPNGWEWAILVLIALLLFAGSRLSGIGRNVGLAVREFKDESVGAAATKLHRGADPESVVVTVTKSSKELAGEDIVEAELVEPSPPVDSTNEQV